MRLTTRQLRRTLLERQHLIERTSASLTEVVTHLLGLQAQTNLPPYLGLAARMSSFHPHQITRGLTERWLVRMLTMRSTVHLLTAADADLRCWTQTVQEREIKTSTVVRPARGVERERFHDAVGRLLQNGPVSAAELGERLSVEFPGVPAVALGNLARSAEALVQVPPRGCWKSSGTVTYQDADRWLGRTLTGPDRSNLVRRYLRAYGPSSVADIATWSGVTGMAGIVRSMPDLRHYQDPAGRKIYDLEELALADDGPMPVRLLGCFDNSFLAHAGRDRLTPGDSRKRWLGLGNKIRHTIFVDGVLSGFWDVAADRVEPELFVSLTLSQRDELEAEISRVNALLAVEKAPEVGQP